MSQDPYTTEHILPLTPVQYVSRLLTIVKETLKHVICRIGFRDSSAHFVIVEVAVGLQLCSQFIQTVILALI